MHFGSVQSESGALSHRPPSQLVPDLLSWSFRERPINGALIFLVRRDGAGRISGRCKAEDSRVFLA